MFQQQAEAEAKQQQPAEIVPIVEAKPPQSQEEILRLKIQAEEIERIAEEERVRIAEEERIKQQERKIRQELFSKQQELMKVKQQQVELELAQAKAKLEETKHVQQQKSVIQLLRIHFVRVFPTIPELSIYNLIYGLG